MVRFALVGAGWQGQGHLTTLKEVDSVEVVGICDLNQVLLEKASKKFGIQAFDDYREMLQLTAPDAVLICTPPEARLALVKEAAERGIHCFIEKPPAKNLEMATDILAVLEEFHVINSVGFMYRYSQAVDFTKQLLKGQKIRMVRSQMLDGLALRPNWPKWFFNKRISGGPAFDQAIHLFDLSRYILGEDVEQLVGFQDNLVVPKSEEFTVEDSFSLTMKYNNGVIQTHTHTWSYDGHVTQLDFIAETMRITLDLGEGRVEGELNGETILFEAEDNSLYKLELLAFAEAVRTNQPGLVRSSYSDSLQSLRTALKAVEALESGQVVHA